MKAIQYIAPQNFGAFQKVGYLFENGIFICPFSYHNVPAYICRKYDFNSPPDKLSWGKGVIDPNSISDKPGAVKDYQFFERKEVFEVDFDKMKKEMSTRFFWNEDHHPSYKLL